MKLSLVEMLFAFAIIFVSLFYLFLRHKYNYWSSRNVPFEKPKLIVGSLSFLMRKSFWNYFLDLRRKFPKSDYVGIYLGWKPALTVQTPELARKVLTKDFEHFQDRMTYSSYESDPLGALNLFTVKNPVWSQIRHEISPMFTALRLKQVTELMNGNAKELVLKIKRDHVDRNLPVDLKELFSMFASDTVGSNVFGIKVSALNDPSSPLWYITSHMVKWTFWRGFEFSMIFYVPAVAALMRLQFFSKAATDYIRKLFWKVVKERNVTGANSKDKDLVNHLIRLKENLKLPGDTDSKLADDYMVAQAAVFILGSIDTSSTTLTYCLHELAHHQKEQELLYQEISGAMKEKGKDVLDYDDLIKLKYLTAVVLETLRKFPPLPSLDRICNKRCELNDDITIEKGTTVYVNVMAMHYNEEVYPEPEKWLPERMKDVQESDNMGFSLLPFGDGPRFCIGKRYGFMQVRSAMAQIIVNYKVEPEPTEPYDIKHDPYSVFLAPLSGGRVRFVPRK